VVGSKGTARQGIEPTVRHGADLGYIPVVIEYACGAGDEEAGRRSLESLRFAGDAIFTDSATIGALLRKGVDSI
jgi:biuret amidohydrolase